MNALLKMGKISGKVWIIQFFCWRSTHGEKAVQDFFSQKLVNAVNWVILIDRFGFLSIYFKNMSVLVRCWKEELLLFRVLFYFHLACNCLLFGVSTHLADNSFCFLLFLHICTHTRIAKNADPKKPIPPQGHMICSVVRPRSITSLSWYALTNQHTHPNITNDYMFASICFAHIIHT